MSLNQPTRQPKQKRAIEKKNKIIEAGYKIFRTKGYYNTNTAEIAKKAGVSTGTVYSYFNNKKEIFLEALNYYFSNTMNTFFELFNDFSLQLDIEDLLNKYLSLLVCYHENERKLHDDISALATMDKDILDFIEKFETNTIFVCVDRLKQLGFNNNNIYEKVSIAYHLVECYCHQEAYYHQDFIDYDIMRKEIIRMLLPLFNQ